MLSSVFNRKKVQQKLNNLTQLTHTLRNQQSPPSPASFESPEIVDITISASHHEQQASEPAVPAHREISPSPQVQLNLRRSESLSEWFPSNLLRSEPMAPPERNASLAASSLKSASSGSMRSLPQRGRSASNAREPFESSPDDVIIIEAEKPESIEEEPVETTAAVAAPPTPEVRELPPTPPRKTAPTPIKIPENPTPLKVTLQRSASASGIHSGPPNDFSSSTPAAAAAVHSRPASVYSDVSSSAISGTTIARALVANSFIVTNGSRQSNFRGVTRQDSATLPKGENPFLMSPYWRDKRISNGEIVMNDEEIPPVPPMPTGAADGTGTGRSRRNSASVAEARRQSEARLNGFAAAASAAAASSSSSSSAAGAASSSSTSASASESGPPGPLKRTRTGSFPSRLQKEHYAASRVSTISEASSQQVSPSTPGAFHHQQQQQQHGPSSSPTTTVRSRTSVNSSLSGKHQSSISTSSERHATSSATSLHHDDNASSINKHHSGSSMHSGEHIQGPPPPLPPSRDPFPTSDPSVAAIAVQSTTTSTSSHHQDAPDSASTYSENTNPQPSAGTATSASSVYSPQSSNSMGSTTRTATTDASSVVSPPPMSTSLSATNSFTMYRSNSDRGIRPPPNRPMITVPVGERPHSVPVSASPLSSVSKQMHPSAGPVSAKFLGDSPMDSPDWLDVMVPKSALILNQPTTTIRRSGSHLPPITVPSGEEDVLSPDNSFSTESPSSESAARQTFPETPYAFSPLVSAGFVTHTHSISSRGSPRVGSLQGRGVVGRGRPAPPRSMLRPATMSKLADDGKMAAAAAAAEGGNVVVLPSSGLPAIDEATPSTPTSQADSSDTRSQYTPDFRSVGSPEARSIATPDTKYTRSPRSEESTPAPSPTSFAHHSPPPTTPPAHSLPPPPAAISASVSSTSTMTTSSTSSATTTSTSATSIADVVDLELAESKHSSARSTLVWNTEALTSSTVPTKRPLTPISPKSADSKSSGFSSSSPPAESPKPTQTTHDLKTFITATPRHSTDRISVALPAYHEEPAPIQPSDPLPPPYRDGMVESMVTRRLARSRPNPPSGPRKPSAPTILLAATRARNGSVTSLHSNSGSRQQPMHSASAPKFQTMPIRLRGLTMEQAQWTLNSEELQEIVSKSIKKLADPAAIRLLPPEVLLDQLGEEKQSLEYQSSELRTSYKLAVRKRRALLASLSGAMDAADFQDQAALIRATEELKEVSDNLDRISEELYSTTDQLSQLSHLEDVHHASAVGMALRKLNASFIKHMQDNHALRMRINELEAERDEGWAAAQEVAAELEQKDPASRRTSRVSVARKNSMRTSKAGLRSPSRRRSGQISARSSGVFSPAMRSAHENIPPVPPIPGRTPLLGIVTTDLPIRSAGIMSDGTPTSEARAMAEAQRELCEMLGISLETFQLGNPPRRRLSLSDMGNGTNLSTHTRRNSEVMTPAWTKDEQRAAVLASIGMVPHEI